MNSDDSVHDDRATQWQGDGLLSADAAPLLSSDTNNQSASKFAKLEDGDRSGEGRQVASSVGLLHANVVHQSVYIYHLYLLNQALTTRRIRQRPLIDASIIYRCLVDYPVKVLV